MGVFHFERAGRCSGKNKKESKVSGNRSHPSKRFWNKSKEVRIQVAVNANEAKVFRAHAPPSGLCGNLINALKLLAHQQKDGCSPRQSIVTGLHERSRRGHHGRAKKIYQSR